MSPIATYSPEVVDVIRGGATVLKVGGQFCERNEPKKFFDPPLFGQWRRDKILLR